LKASPEKGKKTLSEGTGLEKGERPNRAAETVMGAGRIGGEKGLKCDISEKINKKGLRGAFHISLGKRVKKRGKYRDFFLAKLNSNSTPFRGKGCRKSGVKN